MSSYYTYIYKLNPADVLKIYKYPDTEPDVNILRHLVDSFKTDEEASWLNNLPAGNYMKVFADKNKIRYNLIENRSAFVQVIRNNYDLRFLITDAAGNKIKNAKVTIKNNPVRFDTTTQCYRAPLKSKTLMCVEYAGVANFFLVKPNYYHSVPIFSAKWFAYRWYQIRSFVKKNTHGYDDYVYRERLTIIPNYTGFIVFNKPKYKPRDTVKLKAFIVGFKSKKPIGVGRLLVRIQNRPDENGQVLGYVTSYRPGAFEYDFVLADSLKLSLDDDYYVSLEDPSSTKYDLDKYDSDEDEYKYLSKRKVYMAGKFSYEDYDLKTVSFNMRTDKREHQPGEQLSVFLKARDENELPVQDGRVNLTLVTREVDAIKADKVFVPDTLWTHKVQLDPVGETKVVIPDSIFPKANLHYVIKADFFNSDNEHRDADAYLNFIDNNYKIETDLSSDTMKVNSFFKGQPAKTAGEIYAVNNAGDTVTKTKTMLPSAFALNPSIRSYVIKTDSAAVTTDISSMKSDLEFAGYQTADSLFVKVSNPHNIHFWYWVVNNNKLIDEGEANSLFYKKKYTHKGSVIFILSYLWGGDTRLTGLAIPYQDKLLNIDVKQPVSVYPGETVKTEIAVTDAFGKPVPDADITAWSITRKFDDYKSPFVPYLGRLLAGYRAKPFQNVSKTDYSGSLLLDWARWRKEMGLDSIEYFTFIHPADIYKIEETAPDSITQIAPFIMDHGDIDVTHVLFIDGRPVYFDQAEQLQRYSFRVTPGRHSLSFRTSFQRITLDSVYVEKGKKLILSLNEDSTLNKKARFAKMPDTLTRYETGLLNNYLIRVVDNFGPNMATVQQGDQLLLLNPNPQSNTYNTGDKSIVVCPVTNNYASFSVKGQPTRTFLPEPHYSYRFEPGLLKQKSIKDNNDFNKVLVLLPGITSYTQYAVSRAETDSIWNHYLGLRSHTTPLFRNDRIEEKITGRLSIEVNPGEIRAPFIKNIIIYRENDPDFMRVFPGGTTNLGILGQGNYRLFFLLEQNDYFIENNITIKPNGANYYKIKIIPHPKDEVSDRIDSVIINRTSSYEAQDSEPENDALKLKEAFNKQYTTNKDFRNTIFGRVIGSDDKLPVVGCTVRIKGTSYGAVTDINGRFTLKVPASGHLLISYIGYVTQQVNITPGATIEIKLVPSSSSLNEVVVVGYGTERRKDLTGSVSTVTQSTYGDMPVNIRGMSQLADKRPLIIVDGVQVESMDGIDPSIIDKMTTLKDAGAAAIYGIKGGNGVVIITTKKKNNASEASDTLQQSAGASIRKNFSDYAYWQPRLTTDKEGKASFTTTFPDDITNWRTFVIGINDRQQSGFSDHRIKAFKPLSATLITPLFAVSGDELSLIGKVLNYSVDTIKVTRTFSYNHKQLTQDLLIVKNSKIDTLNVTAANADSLTFEYSIKRGSGYFDGEQRNIPVIAQGVKETKGMFAALDRDTTINMKFDPALGPATIRAEASVLPALADETQRLREYKYLCNEQLASKLKGLLAEKRIKKFLGEPFKYEKNIDDIIEKLEDNRSSQGTWGWWKDTDEELWISLHAIEALADAKNQGYQIGIDTQKLTDYLVLQLESYHGEDKLTCLRLLHKLNAKVDYAKYAGIIGKEFELKKEVSEYNKLSLMLLRQQAGLPFKLDSLFARERHTMFGNLYWGEDCYRFFDNSVQVSILAYKILEADGNHPDLLSKIRGYFLEQRNTGQWRNTYESSLILETILPGLLKENKKVKPAVITIKGAQPLTINNFPYTASLTGNQISITKTGDLPVYLTGYQQFWNPRPEKVSGDFTVDTWFERNGDKAGVLKGGEAVKLKAEITLKGDADYVMIEIPIPAGCSYNNKEQSWMNNEVHREFFKEKVSIFCRKLKQGKYEFSIDLMPRYSGKYTLNPAKAGMMYFPVFFGREGIKQVKIGN